MKKQELIEAAEAAGWTVGQTTNLHLEKDGKAILVETFDEDDNPCYYAMNSAHVGFVSIGGDMPSGPLEADRIDDVLDMARVIAAFG